ncbi:SDR family oxidoreductase [Pseudomonas sp. RIT-PI-AD]|uniref:SDR family oxidoreductase n=1 Tax=Pseudomonas sp. RIT-PI-AD TaxID=3035294 RepID=UPI0021D896B8|nr:SDR family oxidoreductase [Pseudomonas sp. RIT-PI-AD]
MRNILITGTSRGIGLGLARAFLDEGARVHAVARGEKGADGLRALQARHGARLRLLFDDLAEPATDERVLAALGDEALDFSVFNAGIQGPAHQDPARAEGTEIATLFMTNAIAPLRLAQRIAPRVKPGGVVAFLSSQMGSVSLARAGDMPLYGASKAALNSLLRSWSARCAPLPYSLLALHPGWVQTDMGGGAAPLSVEQSVEGLMRVLHAQTGRNRCEFFDYQGARMPW